MGRPPATLDERRRWFLPAIAEAAGRAGSPKAVRAHVAEPAEVSVLLHGGGGGDRGAIARGEGLETWESETRWHGKKG